MSAPAIMAAEKPDDSNIWRYWAIFRRRWIPATSVFLGVFALMLINTLAKADVYQARGRLLFKPDDSSPAISSLEAITMSGAGTSEAELETHIQIMLSKPILEGVANTIDEQINSDINITPDYLYSQFRVIPLGKTRVIQVNFNSTDPQVAEAAVNQLMLAYIRNNLARNRTAAVSVRQFLTEHLPEVKQRLFETESAVRRFREANNIIDVETAASAFVQRQVDLQTEIEASNAQLQNLDVRIRDAQRKLGMSSTEALAVSALSRSTAVQDSLTKLEEVERELATARVTLASDHPQILNLEDEQAELQGVLQGSISRLIDTPTSPTGEYQVDEVRSQLMLSLVDLEAQRNGLQAQIVTASDYQNLYDQQGQLIPALEQQYRELLREFNAAEATYASLLKSLQEIRVTENQTIPTVEVIESASRPTTPVLPNRIAEAIRGAILGILAAGGVVYLLELSDRRLKTVDDIRDVYPYSVLGTIPFFELAQSNAEHLETLHQTHSALGESYRMLQSNLKFLSSDVALKSFVVSSAIPSEGKSTTIASLAVTLADMGHRVLLIDADTRRPAQHQLWEVPNHTGLSNLLASTEDVTGILRVQPVIENVDLLTAGIVPPNPLLLLDSDRMRQLIVSQSHQYDYVLIDAPPISVATDAMVLSKITNGLLLVARPDVLEKTVAIRVRESLTQFDVQVLGLVVNGVLVKNETSTHYYHQYYTNSSKNGSLGSLEPNLSVNKKVCQENKSQ